MATDATPLSRPSERYIELVGECPLRPIRTEAELSRAVGMIDRLTDKADRTTEEEDYRDVLADLVHAYELANEPEPESDDSPSEMLRYLIEARGVAPAKLSEDTGISEETISQVLSGEREPSRRVMAALGSYFAVHPSVFLVDDRPSHAELVAFAKKMKAQQYTRMLAYEDDESGLRIKRLWSVRDPETGRRAYADLLDLPEDSRRRLIDQYAKFMEQQRALRKAIADFFAGQQFFDFYTLKKRADTESDRRHEAGRRMPRTIEGEHYETP